MINAEIKSDSNGCFIEIKGKPNIYLKDSKGKITLERFTWIEKFLGVKIITDGYEVIYRLKKGGLAKWTIDSFGVKQAFQNIKDESIDKIIKEFKLDINSLSQQEFKKLKEKELIHKYSEKAKTYYYLGKHNKAEYFYLKAAILSNDNYIFVKELATCFTLQFKFKQALEAYLYLAIKYPDRELNTLHLKQKLMSYIKQAEDLTIIDYSIEILEKIISISKKRNYIFDLLGELFWYKGEKTKALELKLLASNERTLNQKKINSLNIVSIDISKVNFKIPDFLVIGPQKSGTTALYQYLTEHPHIYPASVKEIFFFDLNYKLGIDWYKSHFPVLPEFKYLTGEASATYFNKLEAPERIASLIPDVKLIFIIRDPVYRAISDYHMKLRNGVESRNKEEAIIEEINYLKEKSLDFVDIGKNFFKVHKGYVRNGLYFYFIKAYLDKFSKNSIIVINSQQLLEQPRETMKNIFNFLGVENYVGNYPLINVGNYSKQENDFIVAELANFFKPYNQMLEELIDLRLNWQ
jgi:hypothetical protein